ncbi:MAG: MetQ/NlpA family ABC transporter substrate-binding protein [Eubacteriales bacterium]|nr:MetQ/NlpA family ABC transporter substrate-binding protein [Eubacteriales bacterium]
MNKKKIASLLAGVLCLSALTACGGNDDAKAPAQGGDAAAADKTITIGATPTPHAEILNAAKDALAEAGWTLNVVEFTDYVQPNTALVDGDLDANYFQHVPYMNNFNQENGADLVSAIELHYEPFGLYAGKTATIDELADGATISVPNDGSNETRALLLLQDAGLIKLKGDVDPTTLVTVLDIEENPKNLNIQEIAAEQLPRSLEDVDMAVINGNYALQADLNAAEDSLITEDPDYAKVYINTVACRSGDENGEKIQALEQALRSDAVRQFVEETYKGAVVLTF